MDRRCREQVQTPFPHTVNCRNRCAVVRKRATRDLQRAQARLHLVQGFLLAMNDLDKVLPLAHAAIHHACTPPLVYVCSCLAQIELQA